MSKKKIATGIGCGVLAVAAVAFAFVYTGTKGTVEALKDNQRYVYAYISDIEGNEITYTEMEESVVTAYLASRESETEDAEAAQEAEENRDDRGDATEREQSSGDAQEQPSGNARGERTAGGPDGEMPAGGLDGEMPTGEVDGEMPTGGPDGEMPTGEAGMSGEIVTTLIPVGITVHTADDTTTTFQRLASGDMLKLLLETDEDGEEVITEIWMLS